MGSSIWIISIEYRGGQVLLKSVAAIQIPMHLRQSIVIEVQTRVL